MLTRQDYVDLITKESARIGGLSVSELATPVKHLPNWSVKEVVGHIGWAMRYAALSLASDNPKAPSRSAVADPPPSNELEKWFKQSAETLLEMVETVALETPAATMVGPKTADWLLKRTTLELAIHRFDVEVTLTKVNSAKTFAPRPIESRLAALGIDEVFDVFAPTRLNWQKFASSGETLHLHATDDRSDHSEISEPASEWFIEFGDELTWRHSHQKASCAVRATRSNLLLLLWSRLKPTEVETFGDVTIVERWQNATAF